METKTFIIHESNRSEVEKKIEFLNKRFIKHNIPTLEYTWSEKDEFDKMNFTVTYKDVPTISGVPYKYLGFVMYEDGSKFFNGFDEEDTEKFETIKSMNCTCNMCKKEITNRNSFFVFENKENEEIKMFGSSCAKKAFPFNIDMYFNGLQNMFDTLEDLCEDEEGFDTDIPCFGGKRYFNIDRVINTLSLVSNDFTCWISQEKADMEYPRVMSTKNQVIDVLTSKR